MSPGEGPSTSSGQGEKVCRATFSLRWSSLSSNHPLRQTALLLWMYCFRTDGIAFTMHIGCVYLFMPIIVRE